MVKWNISMELRLAELAKEGFSGADVAAKLSAEFGEFFSENSVFHKANRLGFGLKGRSPQSRELRVAGDPFGPPAWLPRELAKEEERKREAPSKVILFGWEHSRDEITDDMIKQARKQARQELWDDYVLEVLRKSQCTSRQAEDAYKKIPEWFKRWSKVVVVVAWGVNLNRVRIAEEALEKVTGETEEEINFNELSEDVKRKLLEAEEVLSKTNT